MIKIETSKRSKLTSEFSVKPDIEKVVKIIAHTGVQKMLLRNKRFDISLYKYKQAIKIFSNQEFKIDEAYYPDLLFLILYFHEQYNYSTKQLIKSGSAVNMEKNRLQFDKLFRLVDKIIKKRTAMHDYDFSFIVRKKGKTAHEININNSDLIFDHLLKNVDLRDGRFWIGIKNEESLKRAKRRSSSIFTTAKQAELVNDFKNYLDSNSILYSSKYSTPNLQMKFIAKCFLWAGILSYREDPIEKVIKNVRSLLQTAKVNSERFENFSR